MLPGVPPTHACRLALAKITRALQPYPTFSFSFFFFSLSFSLDLSLSCFPCFLLGCYSGQKIIKKKKRKEKEKNEYLEQSENKKEIGDLTNQYSLYLTIYCFLSTNSPALSSSLYKQQTQVVLVFPSIGILGLISFYLVMLSACLFLNFFFYSSGSQRAPPLYYYIIFSIVVLVPLVVS